jgi:hypothetical protein
LTKANVPCAAGVGVGLGLGGVGEGLGFGVGVAVGWGDVLELTLPLPHPARNAIMTNPRMSTLQAKTDFFIFDSSLPGAR